MAVGTVPLVRAHIKNEGSRQLRKSWEGPAKKERVETMNRKSGRGSRKDAASPRGWQGTGTIRDGPEESEKNTLSGLRLKGRGSPWITSVIPVRITHAYMGLLRG